MSRVDVDCPNTFDELYRSTAEMVYAFCLRILQDRDDAADAMQQTFVNAWRARESFRGESRVTTWLLTIARRAAYRIIRNRRRGSSGEIPGELVERSEQLQDRIALEQAIAMLPSRMRFAVVLYYVHDRTIGESAKIMGVAEGTVKAHLNAARGLLRRVLQ